MPIIDRLRPMLKAYFDNSFAAERDPQDGGPRCAGKLDRVPGRRPCFRQSVHRAVHRVAALFVRLAGFFPLFSRAPRFDKTARPSGNSTTSFNEPPIASI